ISAGGSTVIECQFECQRGAAGSFREGLARVARGGKWGYINPAGEFAIAPRFDMASEFSEGLGGVEIGKRRGFVHASGEMAIPISYRWADPFSEGLAAVSVGTGEAHKSVAEACESGFIDHSGAFQIPPRFLSAGRFVGGICLVEDEDHIGYVDHSGEFVWRAPYVEIGSFDPLHLLPPERD
ncbi:MAG: WG repeat-containing protein, partial [Candidatus Acidiferrales bacterium]